MPDNLSHTFVYLVLLEQCVEYAHPAVIIHIFTTEAYENEDFLGDRLTNIVLTDRWSRLRRVPYRLLGL